MQAIIFDIDGTLLDSFDSDAEMFSDAIRSVLGNVRIREQWGMYEHVTDNGILADVGLDNGIEITPAIARAIEADHLRRLTNHVATRGAFAEIPGARDYVVALKQRPDVCIAYATGAWRSSALLKLTSAGFPLDGIPLATSDDHHERARIMRHALSQLPHPVRSITYYGDGEWDVAATSRLGWNFVPVGAKLGGLTRFEPQRE